MSKEITKVEVTNASDIGGTFFFATVWLLFIWMALQSVSTSIDAQTRAVQAQTAAYMFANGLEYESNQE